MGHRDNHGAWGLLTVMIRLRLLALAAGLRHDAEIGQPGLCFSAPTATNSESTIPLSEIASSLWPSDWAKAPSTYHCPKSPLIDLALAPHGWPYTAAMLAA